MLTQTHTCTHTYTYTTTRTQTQTHAHIGGLFWFLNGLKNNGVIFSSTMSLNFIGIKKKAFVLKNVGCSLAQYWHLNSCQMAFNCSVL